MILVHRWKCRQRLVARIGINIASASSSKNDHELFVQCAPSSSNSIIHTWNHRITQSADNLTDIDKRTAVRSLSGQATVKHLIEEVVENDQSSKKRIAEKEMDERNLVTSNYQLIKKSMDALFVDVRIGVCGMKFDSFIKDWLSHCGVSDVSKFVRISGKKSKSKSFLHLGRHLPAIAHRLDALSSQKWDAMHISWIIYGLQCFNEDDRGYIDIIKIMTRIATKSRKNSRDVVTAQSISMKLLGLQNNKFKHAESLKLVKEIGHLTLKCREVIDSQVLGNALYGLQGMRSESPEILMLLSELALKCGAVRILLVHRMWAMRCTDCRA